MNRDTLAIKLEEIHTQQAIKSKNTIRELINNMDTRINESRLIPIRLINNNIIQRLRKKWVIEYGYTSSLSEDCILILCLISDL